MRNCERTSRSGDLTVVEARTMRADHGGVAGLCVALVVFFIEISSSERRG